SPRYAADLLLLHGAWSGPSAWGRVAAAMAQRGWRCHLLDLRAAAAALPPGAAGRGDHPWVAGARAAIAELEAPPILVGHGAGALVALEIATGETVRGAIAAAPLAEGARPLASATERFRLRLLGGRLDPPGAGGPVFAGLSSEDAARLASSMVPESASFVRWIDRAATSLGAPAVPALLLAQEDDPWARPVAVEVLARGIGADFVVLPGGHWSFAGQRIDAWASRIHRWIVQRTGGELLLLRGDEDLRED
ncbi:MAG: alpha/beta hydrolase, partial [Alphaproteobacteria bacterium]